MRCSRITKGDFITLTGGQKVLLTSRRTAAPQGPQILFRHGVLKTSPGQFASPTPVVIHEHPFWACIEPPPPRGIASTARLLRYFFSGARWEPQLYMILSSVLSMPTFEWCRYLCVYTRPSVKNLGRHMYHPYV